MFKNLFRISCTRKLRMIHKQYYIIRSGDFAINANKKISYSIFSLGLCLDDYVNRGSIDCFSIMMGSSCTWIAIELFLNITKTRIIKPMHMCIYGNQVKIPKYMGIVLQGIQEGGVVTTFGLYFGDRLKELKYLFTLHLFAGYIATSVLLKKRGAKNAAISSKRQVNTYSSVLTMACATMYNVYMLYIYPDDTRRQLNMLFVMIYVSSIWTIASHLQNHRRVCVEKIDDNVTISNNCSRTTTAVVLGYDVLFEIGVAYLTFYNLFVRS